MIMKKADVDHKMALVREALAGLGDVTIEAVEITSYGLIAIRLAWEDFRVIFQREDAEVSHTIEGSVYYIVRGRIRWSAVELKPDRRVEKITLPAVDA